MKMRKIRRRRRILSVFTTVMLLVFTAWTSFAYAEGEEFIDAGTQSNLEQEVSSQETPTVDLEEDQVDIEETLIIPLEENLEAPLEENENQDEPEMMAQEVQMAPQKPDPDPEPEPDPHPDTDLGIMPYNPNVGSNEHPQVGECEDSNNMFENLRSGFHTEYWGDIKIEINAYDTAYGPKFNFKATDKNSGEPVLISAVYVKGGSEGGNLYDYRAVTGTSSDSNLHTPVTGGSYKYAAISHLVFYYCPPVIEIHKTITFEKIWKDANGQIITDTSDLPEVTVRIYDEQDNEAGVLYLNHGNGWMDKAEGLDADKNYHFAEDEITNLPEGYEISGTYQITGDCDNPTSEERCDCPPEDQVIHCDYTIENTIIKISEKIYRDITVTKVWKDKDGAVIDDETMVLPEVKAKIDFEDEEITDIVLTLDKEHAWTAVAENINPELEYTITEEAVTGLPDGYSLVGEFEVSGECISPIEDSIAEQIEPDNDIKCSYTLVNKIEKKIIIDYEGTISGLKYNDLDKDGYHDAGEAVISGVTINLYDSNPELSQVEPKATAVTNEYGVFSFKVAATGTYYLREVSTAGWTQSAPANNLFTVILTAEDNNFPEDFVGDEIYLNIIQQHVKDESGQLFDVAFVFGNYYNVDETVTVIEGFKFNDLDADGSWDEGEYGLQGWTITLWKYLGDIDESGTLTLADVQNVATATTDANGHYEFVNLESGLTYYVSENVASQAYWTQTYPVTGFELSGTGRMNQVVEIPDGVRISGVNFGNYYYKSSGGGGSSSGSSGGGSTTTTTTTNVLETLNTIAEPEEEVVTLSMPVFSAEPEEVVVQEEVMANQEVEDPDANPQTSDPGLVSQMQVLGLSILAMVVLKKNFR